MDEEESDLSDPQFTNSRLVEKSHEIVTAEPGTREQKRWLSEVEENITPRINLSRANQQEPQTARNYKHMRTAYLRPTDPDKGTPKLYETQ